jgi:PAS domain S-box-containing protein
MRTTCVSRDLHATVPSVLEASPDAMVIVDSTGTIVLVNGETERMFGYEREELIRRPVEILLPDEFRTLHEGYRADYISAPRPRQMCAGLDLWGRRRDGSRFPVEVSLTPMRSENGLLVTAAIRELTAGIALMQRLTRLLTVVEDELGTILSYRRTRSRASPLTARELQVLALATQGLSTREVAEQLIICESTVKTHFANIYQKLHVPDRTAAVAHAIRMGLIS